VSAEWGWLVRWAVSYASRPLAYFSLFSSDGGSGDDSDDVDNYDDNNDNFFQWLDSPMGA
jgi:hypothetical protein